MQRRTLLQSIPAVAFLGAAASAKSKHPLPSTAVYELRVYHTYEGKLNAESFVLFLQIPAIAKTLPDPIDQMKVFELIQIIPSPAKTALTSGNLVNYRISEPRIMGYLRNNSMFAYGKTDRAKTSATMREILDSMWLFNDIFDRALAKFNEIKAQQG